MMASQGFRKPLRPANPSRHVVTITKIENICSTLENTPPSSPDCEEGIYVNPVPKKVRVSNYVKRQDATSSTLIAENSKEIEIVETKGLHIQNYISSHDDSFKPKVISKYRQLLPKQTLVKAKRNSTKRQKLHSESLIQGKRVSMDPSDKLTSSSSPPIEKYDQTQAFSYIDTAFEKPITNTIFQNIQAVNLQSFESETLPKGTAPFTDPMQSLEMNTNADTSDSFTYNSPMAMADENNLILPQSDMSPLEKKQKKNFSKKSKSRKGKRKTLEDATFYETSDRSESLSIVSEENSLPANQPYFEQPEIEQEKSDNPEQATFSNCNNETSDINNEEIFVENPYSENHLFESNNESVDQVPNSEPIEDMHTFIPQHLDEPQQFSPHIAESISIDKEFSNYHSSPQIREYSELNDFSETSGELPSSEYDEDAPAHSLMKKNPFARKNKKSEKRKKMKFFDSSFSSSAIVDDGNNPIFEDSSLDLINSSYELNRSNDQILEEMLNFGPYHDVAKDNVNAYSHQVENLPNSQHEEVPSSSENPSEIIFETNVNQFKNNDFTEPPPSIVEHENLFDFFQNDDSSIQTDSEFDTIFNNLVQLGYEFFKESDNLQTNSSDSNEIVHN